MSSNAINRSPCGSSFFDSCFSPAPRTHAKWGSVVEDARNREQLEYIFDAKEASSSEYASRNLIELEYERLRRKLMRLIDHFVSDGLLVSPEHEVKCDAASGEAACAFLRALPAEHRLPKIAPDGEGGILLAWEEDSDQIIMIIHDWILYPVVNVARDARHLSTINFDGEKIPEKILHYIPNN